jgi:hypothetical protein
MLNFKGLVCLVVWCGYGWIRTLVLTRLASSCWRNFISCVKFIILTQFIMLEEL